jgi:hypothetical protein
MRPLQVHHGRKLGWIELRLWLAISAAEGVPSGVVVL